MKVKNVNMNVKIKNVPGILYTQDKRVRRRGSGRVCVGGSCLSSEGRRILKWCGVWEVKGYRVERVERTGGRRRKGQACM